MNAIRRRLAGEQGIGVIIAILILTVLVIFSGALITAATSSNGGVNRDEIASRAFQAAEAGQQTALHRLNMEQPVAPKCITTSVTDPVSGGWCAPTAWESLGHGQWFRYQVSIQRSTNCSGTSLGSSVVERCIVATGWSGSGSPGATGAGNVSRRVISRVAALSGSNPFQVSGITGSNGVTIKNFNNGNNSVSNVNADIGTNGQLTVGNNTKVTGTVYLGPGAPNPVLNPGASLAGGTQPHAKFILDPPNMINSATAQDSSTSNDNGRLLPNASPADSCTNGSTSVCYVNTGSSPRTLNLSQSNASVTLGGGVYNFCQINLANGAQVNIAANATVIIFLDSPARSGSGCVSGQGGLSAGNGASFSNPSGNPTALQLVAYGFPSATPTSPSSCVGGNPPAACIPIPNNNAFTAAIYAPNSTVAFQNNAAFSGGLAASWIQISNSVQWDSRVSTLQYATTLVFYRADWRECQSAVPSGNDPTPGCPSY